MLQGNICHNPCFNGKQTAIKEGKIRKIRATSHNPCFNGKQTAICGVNSVKCGYLESQSLF